MVELVASQYGKSRVRLMKVTRKDGVHELLDWTVEVLVRGEFTAAHVEGDNSRILATDTMKNMVYSVARSSSATSMEEYAKELTGLLLERNGQVDSVTVLIESALWKRLATDGRPDPANFMHGSGERQTAEVERFQDGRLRVTSGLTDMVLLKTANSGFEGFLRDEWTTLKETSDRLMGTAMRAKWIYVTEDVTYKKARYEVREAMLATFARHKSRSVQETLYAIG